MTLSSSRPLRIAILGSRGFPSTYGGYETFVRRAARTWVAQGHDVTVYCRSRPEGVRGTTWTAEGVRCIWTPGKDSKSLSTLSYGFSSHVDAAFRNFDAALVLNIANGFFLPILRRRHIPTVLNTDGIEWERGKWGRGARAMFYRGAKMSARHATLLVSDSEAIGRIWDQEFGVSPRFIPYGADVEQERNSNRVIDLGLTPGKYVLVVARLIPENNVELTLDAVDLGPNAIPTVVVGSANYESPLAARLDALTSSGAVTWLGHVADQQLLTDLWANAGVYVHGHSVGGTNPALLQALGAGAPTLALDTAFNREVLQDESHLYPADAQTLNGLIRKVLSSADLQREWTTRGKQIVGTRYRWDDVCTAYENALRAAMSRVAVGD